MTETTEEKPAQRPWMIFWLVLLMANLPMMIPYLTGLWDQPHYQFFPFVFLAVGVMVYQRWDRVWMPPLGWISCLGVGLSLFVSILGSVFYSPYLPALGFVSIASIFLLSHSERTLQSLFPIALLVGLLVRIPLGLDQVLINRLQITTTALSSVMLDFLRVPHATGNNTIQLASRELFVAEACSGIQSVFTLIFIAMLLIVIYRRPVWLSPLYIAVGILLAVFANVIRVTTVALGDAWIGMDLAKGWQHELVGYVALGIGVLFLLSFDHLIISVLHPVEHIGASNPFIDSWNHFFEAESGSLLYDLINRGPEAITRLVRSRAMRVAFMILAGCVGVHGAVSAAQNKLAQYDIVPPDNEIIIEVDESLLDIPLKNLTLTNHEKARDGQNSRLGENANLWNGHVSSKPEVEVQVVLSQPFNGFHELCVCYSLIQWNILNREVLSESDGNTKLPKFALARLKKESTAAYLIYSSIDSKGVLLTPPPTLGRLGSRFEDFFTDAESRKTESSGPVLMLQIFVVFRGDFDNDLLPDLISDFDQIRSTVSRALVANAESKEVEVGTDENVNDVTLPQP